MRLPTMVRDLVENMDDLVFSLDKRKKITYVNRKWKEVFGYDEEEIRRLTIEDLLPEDQIDHCMNIIERVTEEKALRVEVAFLTKDRRRIEVEGNVIGRRENGEFKGCLGIFKDVTERRELERKLRESEERFRVIAEESLLGIFVLKDGKLSYINKIVQTATGYSRNELLQMDPFSLIVDEHKPLAIKALDEALKGKKTFVEVKYKTKDGRERWVLMSLTRITLDFEPVILGNWYDITQTKILEEKLRKSEEEYRNLVENALIGVYKTMLSGKIVLANKALLDMLEVTKEEFYSMNAAEFYRKKKDREELLRILKEEGRVMGFETELVTKSGKSINVLISAVLEGEFISGTIMNITERKIMENKLIDLTEKMRLLNKILRHDISNDITAILGAIEIYKMTGDKSLLDDAIKAAERSSHLIKEIRELESLISSGKLKPVDLNQVIESIKQSYNIEFKIEGNCKALADDAISSVINNIVRNAIIHGKTHRIDVKLRELNGYCEIRIADYGKGIPDEIKEDVFKEGFKYGDTAHTGLGLYIAKSVIERYGGEIWIEDNKPQGCVFVIKLKKAQ